LWPLYNRLLRHAAVAHRLAVVCKLPLFHYGWDSAPRSPSAPAPGSQTICSRFSFTLSDVAALIEDDFDLSVPGIVRASLPCPRVDLRLGSAATCSGLQATPDSYYAAGPPLSGESVPPGCRPPTPGSHIHRVRPLLNALFLPRLGRIFHGFLRFPYCRFQPCGSPALI